MRATEFLIESLDTDIEYKVIDSNSKVFTTSAEIDGCVIIFEASRGPMIGRWRVAFYQYNPVTKKYTYEKTDSGSELAIFSFVMKSLTEFLNKYKPYAILFTADKAESSRVRLYSRMVKKYADRFGYVMTGSPWSPAVEQFRLERKDGEGQ